MHASLVAQRTKAIRALGSLITVDPEVLLEVRSTVCPLPSASYDIDLFFLTERNQGLATRQIRGQFAGRARCGDRPCR